MPTIPPGRTPLPEHERREPHQARQVAESFGSDAERYDRARPRYPDAMVAADRRRQSRPGRPGCRLRYRHSGPAVPGGRLPGARGRARRADGRRGPAGRRRGRGGDVRSLGRAGRAFDAVIAGQAWHWVDPVAGAAKAAQALRPGGRLAVFWNVVPAPGRPGGSVRRGLPPRAARLAVQPRARCPARMRTRRCSPRRPTGYGRRARSAMRSSGDSTGTGPTPATSGWNRCRPSAATASSRRPRRRSCWRASAPPSTRWGAASRWATRLSWSPRCAPGPPQRRTAPRRGAVREDRGRAGHLQAAEQVAQRLGVGAECGFGRGR